MTRTLQRRRGWQYHRSLLGQTAKTAAVLAALHAGAAAGAYGLHKLLKPHVRRLPQFHTLAKKGGSTTNKKGGFLSKMAARDP